MKVYHILWTILIILGILGWLDMLGIKYFPSKDLKEHIFNLTIFLTFWLRFEYLMGKK